ncbi:hypothetical protein AVEN_159781-1 [Araneus ventricosus]|uniref:Uncharacterized protein n=1 Tax=Araneus ventricosus TaxID=182803 RepID=A0A4Y2D9B0_ARAVE|nr:hypothetical protein AVEN_159781-1 [Araneus ventricosus]
MLMIPEDHADIYQVHEPVSNLNGCGKRQLLGTKTGAPKGRRRLSSDANIYTLHWDYTFMYKLLKRSWRKYVYHTLNGIAVKFYVIAYAYAYCKVGLRNPN